jgi:hypothetical protein
MLCGFIDQFFRQLVGVPGMLLRLFAEFVRRQMIFFAMGDGGGQMCVGGKIMQFRGSFVRSL